ncbi:VOC family protein [Shewanella sp. JM162201]|uniref:VOC family protein n=1 Tax=Shewanella jiangmenensis TaxID=2837387 RepID=A0ABS5V5M4_9GAMM|nr:VOC family protein [Shewanella jiangmenensis]MBT1445765.1 VOC family protein [Shewanella jiangmenensis]
MHFDELIQSLGAFEGRILALVERLGLKPLGLECDHISLRVNSNEAADRLADGFKRIGDVISNNMINGRPILIIKLHEPLKLGSMAVRCVELPYPGSKLYPAEGWEHIELVLPCNAHSCDELASELVNMVPTLAPVLAGETDIKVKASSPSGEAERLPNPTLAFGANGLTVKVHPHSIEAIINSEQ